MKILLVDDHALVRDALHGVLKQLVEGVILLEASNCSQATQVVQAHADLRLILLDLSLPDRDGMAFLADLRKRHAAISVVVLSGSQDRDTVMRALRLGALGFIPKSSTRNVMASALQLVLSGGVYIPPEPLTPAEIAPRDGPAAQAVSPSDVGLTVRQMEVIALMMQGKSNKAISRILDVAEPTVKHHVTAILKALKVTNRTEAVIAVGALNWELPHVADRQ